MWNGIGKLPEKEAREREREESGIYFPPIFWNVWVMLINNMAWPGNKGVAQFDKIGRCDSGTRSVSVKYPLLTDAIYVTPCVV